MSDPENPTPVAPALDIHDVRLILKALSTATVPMVQVEQAFRTMLKIQALYDYLLTQKK